MIHFKINDRECVDMQLGEKESTEGKRERERDRHPQKGTHNAMIPFP